jgi:FixJ family two-component response regulator
LKTMELRHSPGFVHLVDDDASFRAAMERRLKHAGYEVATYTSAEDLLARLPNDTVPGCLLLDVRIPGMSGPELQERLNALGSTLPIIFLTGYPDVRTTVKTVKAGAEDFLTKPVPSNRLLQAVERAFAHHEMTRGLKSEVDAVRSRIATLTPREREVFALIIRGRTNKQVGSALGASERTIKAHRHRVMEKMQVVSLAELVPLAERAGVLEGASSSPWSPIEQLKRPNSGDTLERTKEVTTGVTRLSRLPVGAGFQPLKANKAVATSTTVKVPKPTTAAMNQRSCITREG